MAQYLTQLSFIEFMLHYHAAMIDGQHKCTVQFSSVWYILFLVEHVGGVPPPSPWTQPDEVGGPPLTEHCIEVCYVNLYYQLVLRKLSDIFIFSMSGFRLSGYFVLVECVRFFQCQVFSNVRKLSVRLLHVRKSEVSGFFAGGIYHTPMPRERFTTSFGPSMG